MKTSETIKEIIPAWLKVQKAMKAVKKGETAVGEKFSYDYANLESVIENAKDVLNKNDMAFIQAVDSEVVTTRLIHLSGEWIEDSGVRILSVNPNDPQKQGSAITYARRYGLMTITGMPAEDDDGKLATKSNTTEEPDPTEDWDKEFPDKDDEKKVCSKCGSETNFRSGTNAAGKKYAGNFCQNGECKNVDWINVLNVFPSIR